MYIIFRHEKRQKEVKVLMSKDFGLPEKLPSFGKPEELPSTSATVLPDLDQDPLQPASFSSESRGPPHKKLKFTEEG